MKRSRPKRKRYQMIDPDDVQGEEAGKAIILHGFSPAQLLAIVEAYRANREFPQDVAFAMVTEASARRRLGDVVAELQEDAREADARRNAVPPRTPSADA